MEMMTPDNHLSHPLWIDQANAPAQLELKLQQGEVTKAEGALIKQFMRNGFTMLEIPGIADDAKQVCAEVEALWEEPPFDLTIAGQGNERPTPMREAITSIKRGPSARLMDIHSHSPAAMRLYLNHHLHRLCSILFGEQAIATQSLYFEYGSTQGLHRDPWYVNHNPRTHLLAAWFALEDILPDSGPLNYVPGSHKLPYYRFSTDDIVFHDPRVTPEERQAAYDDMFQQMQKHNMQAVPALPKLGQIFVWHGNLIHGGSPVIRPDRTRRSFVVHFGRRDTHLRRGAGVELRGERKFFFTTEKCVGPHGTTGWQNPVRGVKPEDFLPPSTTPQVKTVKIIGMSHAKSLSQALRLESNTFQLPIEFVHIPEVVGGKDFMQGDENDMQAHPALAEKIAQLEPEKQLIFSMVGGNEHNFLGLFQHPKPFDFILPTEPDLPLVEGAEVLPYAYLKELLIDYRKRETVLLAKLKEKIGGEFFHLESPPPIRDNDFCKNNLPPSFRTEHFKQREIAAPFFRYKLWRMHSENVRQDCERLGIQFIPCPPESMDEEGFLLPEYYRDPLHGNDLYGALVLTQIAEIMQKHTPQGAQA